MATAGANGSISPSGYLPVNIGTDKAFTITPNAGYRIAYVLVDGSSVGAVSSYPFTDIKENHTIMASFAENPSHTITARAGDNNGSILPAGTISGL